MAHLQGVSSVAYGTTGPQAAQPGNPAATFDAAAGKNVINGAPVRIVVLALAAATGLTVLKLAGFRFNVAGSFK